MQVVKKNCLRKLILEKTFDQKFAKEVSILEHRTAVLFFILDFDNLCNFHS